MNGKRQKTHCSVALEPAGEVEALSSGLPRAEPFAANPAPETPASAEQLMEEVCSRANLEAAWKRVRRNKGSSGSPAATMFSTISACPGSTLPRRRCRHQDRGPSLAGGPFRIRMAPPSAAAR